MLAKPVLDEKPTVATMMSADHRRLNQLWDELETALELCRIESIRRRVAELSLGLLRYIDIEEALLFPLLEAQTGTNGTGPTAAMRSEHRQIEHALAQVDKLRRITDCATILQSFEQAVEPAQLFESHCRKEEAVLYPVMDMVFNPAENRELLPVVQAFEI